MATPNTNFTAGNVLSAAQMNRFPRGVMNYYKGTADQTIGTTVTDVTGTTLTFTAEAGRLYRATFETFAYCTNASQNIIYMTDNSNVQLDQVYLDIAANQFQTVCFQYLFTATAGSKTMKVRAQASAGTIKFYATTDRSYSFVIEDLGLA